MFHEKLSLAGCGAALLLKMGNKKLSLPPLPVLVLVLVPRVVSTSCVCTYVCHIVAYGYTSGCTDKNTYKNVRRAPYVYQEDLYTEC